jgi:hypothetical protein
MSMAKKWLPSTLAAALAAALILPVSAHAAPSISDVFPDHAPMQSYVTIHGSGFGDAQGTGYVTMGGRWLPVASWTSTAIHVVVNPLAYKQASAPLDTVYPLQVITGAGGSQSNTVNFKLTSGAAPVYAPFVDPDPSSDPPALECLNGVLFCSGDEVTIFGSGFGDAQGTGFVTIAVPFLDAHGNTFMQEFAVPVLAWAENAVHVALNTPAGAQPGTYVLTVHRGNGTTVSGSITAGTIINGNCVPGLPKLSLDHTYLSFGCLHLGESNTLCFTITNTGTGPLDITGVNFSDWYNAGFVLTSSAAPSTLQPGQSRQFCVSFTPRADKLGTWDASVTVTTNVPGSPVFVQFHGTGVDHH